MLITKDLVQETMAAIEKRADDLMLGPQMRSVDIAVEDVNEETSTVTVSFSSEYPVERYWGMEILSHDKDAIIMERADIGLPVTDEHGRQIGIGLNVRVVGRKMLADVTFGASQLAQETFKDVVSKVRRFTSVLYRNYILKELKPRKRDGIPEADPEAGDFVPSAWGPPRPAGEQVALRWFRAVKWMPMSFGFVSLPADPTVGARAENVEEFRSVAVQWLEGRAEEAGETAVTPAEPEGEEGNMLLRKGVTVPHMDDAGKGGGGGGAGTPPATVTREDTTAAEARGAEAAEKRTAEVIKVLRHYGKDAMIEKALEERWDVARAREEILAHMPTPDAAREVKEEGDHDPTIGLTDKEIRESSIGEACLLYLEGRFKGSKYDRMSEAVAQRVRKEPAHGGFLWPFDIVQAPMRGYDQLIEKRGAALTGASYAGVAGTGQGGIGTTHRPDLFIDLLRNATRVIPMGATVLSGLVGNISIPKLSAAASYGWIDPESYAGTDSSSMTIGAVTATPRTIRARQDIKRHMLLQGTPAVDAMVSRELALRLGIAVDYGAIAGSGLSNQPTGILNTGSIGDVSHGANGGAPSWSSAVELWKDVAMANAAFGSLGHLTSAKVAGKLMTVGRRADGDTASFGFVWENDRIGGYPASWSNNVPDTLTKGGGTSLSAWLFGNWMDLLIFLWGMLEIKPDPYADADADGLVIRAFQSADIGVRHPESFSAAQDVDAS